MERCAWRDVKACVNGGVHGEVCMERRDGMCEWSPKVRGCMPSQVIRQAKSSQVKPSQGDARSDRSSPSEARRRVEEAARESRRIEPPLGGEGGGLGCADLT
jgi:hypothetical protein